MAYRLNPTNGIISDDAQNNISEQEYQRGKKRIEAQLRRPSQQERQIRIKEPLSPTQVYLQQSKEKGQQQKILRQAESKFRVEQIAKQKMPSVFTKRISTTIAGRTYKSLTAKDKAKIARFKHTLQTKKLKNQLEKYKIQRQLENARKSGKLQVAQQVMVSTPMKRLNYPAFSTPMEQKDIDHSFNADIGNGEKSLWGNEKFHGETFFKTNDFFIDEFSNDPVMNIAKKARRNVSPLWW